MSLFIASISFMTAGNTFVSLVTGGAGFIGSHVAETLLREGHQVVCLDNLDGGYVENIPKGATFIDGDIKDQQSLSELFNKIRFDYIFHFAAFASEGLSHFVREFTFRNNQCGTANLINFAVNSGVRGFIFASSAAVYGKAKGSLTEEGPAIPVDPYGVSKLASEFDLRAAHDFFDLPFIIFRLHNVFGERQNLNDPFRNVVGIFLRQLHNGQSLTIYGNGSQTRQFSEVSSIAAMIARSINMPDAWNHIFNLGADESHTILELGQQLSAVAGREFAVEFLPARNEPLNPICSHEKAHALLGGEGNRGSWTSELMKMYSWSVKTSLATRPCGRNIEICRDFPDHWKNRL